MTSIQRVAVLLIACAPSVCQGDLAQQILQSAGVRGGVVIHLGCGDGTLTAAFGSGDGYLVHGLDADPGNVAASRQHIKSLGRYGKVAVRQLVGGHLPYADNLANLVVAGDLGNVPADEVMRVLCPGGVALILEGGTGQSTIKGGEVEIGDRKWRKVVKPWPAEIDEWTHFLHGPDNNAVAHDSVVDLPRRLKWLGAPKFARAHEQAASLSACVTTAGRIFYIVDEAPRSDIRIPSQWFLVARDAFNGVVLWKRPIAKWVDQLRRFRSGPAEMAFRLVAKDDRVYVTLGLDAPVSILDAATGQTLVTVEGTENTRQILQLGEKLIVLVDTAPESTKETESRIRQGLEPAPGSRAIMVADARTGKAVWRKAIDQFVHPTLAAQSGRLFYQTNEALYCVDTDSGEGLWRAERPMKLAGHELGWESPTLVVHDKIVYSADFKTIVAYAVASGSVLWQGASKSGYNSPPDVFIINDLVWLKGKEITGLDPNTGELKKSLPSIGGYMHARCYRNKATDRFFLLGNQGVQFVGLESNEARLHHWMRGTCQYGIMPANGLLYVTPDSCACNMKSKLAGFWAIESDPIGQTKKTAASLDRLERGPAYGRIEAGRKPTEGDGLQSWPVFRHDWSRSGITQATVAPGLSPAWQTKIGGRLSGITVADGKVFVASIDTHTVHALDRQTGKTAWTFTAGSRVDSPPTIYQGMVLFGSADGCVYAVRAGDGEQVWRFRAAPEVKLTFVNGQLESAWPVHGSVMVKNDKVMVTAGRSSYLDGGIRLYQLEPRTGRMISETVMYSPDPEMGKQPADENTKDVRGVLSDILVAEGDDVYMRHAKLDPETGDHTQTGLHLFSPIGLLDDSWWHRAYWVVNTEFIAHWSGWWKVGNVVPSGRILSQDATSVFGYGRDKYPSGNTGQFRGGETYQLFACDRPTAGIGAAQLSKKRAPKKRSSQRQTQKAKKTQQPPPPAAVEYRWTSAAPFHVRAMLVAGDVMFAAGPPALAEAHGAGEEALVLKDPDETIAAWQGERGGLLWAISTTDGKRLAQYKLDAHPVFDGMAATAGRLYLATIDGSVVCFAN